MDSSLLNVVLVASAAIGFFMSISLFGSSFYKSKANNYLALSLFVVAILTFLEWIGLQEIVIGNVLLHSLLFQFIENIRLDLLFGATLYTYFLVQIRDERLKRPRYKWVFFPFYLSVLLEVAISFFDYFLDIHFTGFDIFIYYAKEFGSRGFNVFLILKARSLIRTTDSVSPDKKRWLLRLNLIVFCLILSWILTLLEFYAFESFFMLNVFWLLLSVLFWWILYYGIFRLQVLVQKEEIHEYLVAKSKPIPTGKKKVSRTTTTKVIAQLYQLMEEEELFKDPLLSRADLAGRLETSEGYLSQIINQEINSSVIQFVNEYRIEAAKKLLHDPVFNKYSVEAIGLEAGFKSKSAFYSVFKTSLGMSPGAFRKLQKSPNSCESVVLAPPKP